jgi:hypothetical protein
MMSTLVAVAILLASEEMPENDVIPKSFVILKATADYRDAHKVAITAAQRLSVKLNLRDLSPYERGGHPELTWSKESCLEEFGSFPCYVPRGRWNDGEYLSIETSDGYSGFRPGLYLVVLASGPPADPMLAAALRRARVVYPTVTFKTAPIYIGCIH